MHQRQLADATFSSDSRFLATCAQDSLALVWDVQTGSAAGQALEHPNWVFSVEFSPDNQRLATGCRDGTARIWDWKKGTLICPAMHHDEEVFDVEFSEDGRWLFTAVRDGTVAAWDAATGLPLAPPWNVGGSPRQVIYSNNGPCLIAAGRLSRYAFLPLSPILQGSEVAPDPQKLLDVAQLLSGKRFITSGGLTGMTSAEWIAQWESLGLSAQDLAQQYDVTLPSWAAAR